MFRQVRLFVDQVPKCRVDLFWGVAPEHRVCGAEISDTLNAIHFGQNLCQQEEGDANPNTNVGGPVNCHLCVAVVVRVIGLSCDHAVLGLVRAGCGAGRRQGQPDRKPKAHAARGISTKSARARRRAVAAGCCL
jgi:hypothetical protein